MLRKKYTVQKSFRIDAKLSRDVEFLSEVLDRSQNDLANIALENLIIDNKEWFKDDYLMDKLQKFFLLGISDEFSNNALYIKIDVDIENQKIKFIYTVKIINKTFKEDLELNETSKRHIIRTLKTLTCYLDENSEEIQNYLKERLNYN